MTDLGQARRCWWTAVVMLLVGLAMGPEQGQAQIPREEAWQPLLEHEGVSFRYLFYSRADSHNNGVVLLLHNRNDYRVRFRFRIVFRDVDGIEHEEAVHGSLDTGEMRTGDHDGLFWIPFEDGRSIAELGLRGYRVVPDADV